MAAKGKWICPKCGSTKVARERRPNGNDCCGDCGHKWPSRETKKHLTMATNDKSREWWITPAVFDDSDKGGFRNYQHAFPKFCEMFGPNQIKVVPASERDELLAKIVHLKATLEARDHHIAIRNQGYDLVVAERDEWRTQALMLAKRLEDYNFNNPTARATEALAAFAKFREGKK